MLDNSTADQLLSAIKWRGAQRIADLAQWLGLTHEAVRVHVLQLAELGLVEAAKQNRGVGRPVQLWTLTAAGHARFPDRHAEVTVQLLEAIRATGGEELLENIISSREVKMHAHYLREIGDLADLRARVQRLAELRNAEGYMAEWTEAEGVFTLLENHCPICAAASSCQGFCRSELALFRSVLGMDCRVERVDHIISGARRCAYTISTL
jgi:predicted ArsR family transcriptional regulator